MRAPESYGVCAEQTPEARAQAVRVLVRPWLDQTRQVPLRIIVCVGTTRSLSTCLWRAQKAWLQPQVLGSRGRLLLLGEGSLNI